MGFKVWGLRVGVQGLGSEPRLKVFEPRGFKGLGCSRDNDDAVIHSFIDIDLIPTCDSTLSSEIQNPEPETIRVPGFRMPLTRTEGSIEEV